MMNLSEKHKISLITEGIFPFLCFNCHELKKNKGKPFSSLLMFINKSLKQKIAISESKIERILISS
jgi:hypothetical protein